jgi:hypothetical protein
MTWAWYLTPTAVDQFAAFARVSTADAREALGELSLTARAVASPTTRSGATIYRGYAQVGARRERIECTVMPGRAPEDLPQLVSVRRKDKSRRPRRD